MGLPASLPTAVSEPDKRGLKDSQILLPEAKVRKQAVFTKQLHKYNICSVKKLIFKTFKEYSECKFSVFSGTMLSCQC